MIRILQFSKRNSRKGSVLIMATLTMTVLFGFMGLALDMSYMYFHKRRMQTAADAAAIAGAQEILRGKLNSAIVASAKNDSAVNGFTDATNGVTVTVNNPPLAPSASAGNNRFVEVIVSQAQPTWFMRFMDVGSVTVAARAVAGIGSGQACVYTLNPDASGPHSGFEINGTATANFGCGIYSNSNFRAVGGGCVTASSVSYVGAYSDGSGCTARSVSPGVQIVDPLKDKYVMPAAAPCVTGNTGNTGKSWNASAGETIHISPGTYCNGMDLRGQGSIVFDDGPYIIVGGGLKVSAGVSVTGTNVTFFNTFDGSHDYGAVSINGSGLVKLNAPTTGAYKGLLFYQDPRVTATSSNGSKIAGATTSVYDGIIYFPSTDLEYTGNSSATAGGTDGFTLLIAYNLIIHGTSDINTDYSDFDGISPIQVAQFTE